MRRDWMLLTNTVCVPIQSARVVSSRRTDLSTQHVQVLVKYLVTNLLEDMHAAEGDRTDSLTTVSSHLAQHHMPEVCYNAVPIVTALTPFGSNTSKSAHHSSGIDIPTYFFLGEVVTSGYFHRWAVLSTLHQLGKPLG